MVYLNTIMSSALVDMPDKSKQMLYFVAFDNISNEIKVQR